MRFHRAFIGFAVSLSRSQSDMLCFAVCSKVEYEDEGCDYKCNFTKVST